MARGGRRDGAKGHGVSTMGCRGTTTEHSSGAIGNNVSGECDDVGMIGARGGSSDGTKHVAAAAAQSMWRRRR